MLANTYALEADDSRALFSFYSEGKNGSICKLILFEESDDEPGVFNLGFGDMDADSGMLDDHARSNNGDMDKVLATVAVAIIQFTAVNPNAIIFAQGSTSARNRLYSRMINRFWNIVNELFEIQGYIPLRGWEPYRPNQPYISFQARLWQKNLGG